MCLCLVVSLVVFFFFNDTATTEIYTLSLHDALPISTRCRRTTSAPEQSRASSRSSTRPVISACSTSAAEMTGRSEEHTSELQSLRHLVCRLLLEKKKIKDSHRRSPDH